MKAKIMQLKESAFMLQKLYYILLLLSENYFFTYMIFLSAH